MPFNPTDELTMRFTVTDWNQILAQLQEGPYKLMAPLINKINVQAAQQEQQSQAPAPAPAGFTNGETQLPAGDIVVNTP